MKLGDAKRIRVKVPKAKPIKIVSHKPDGTSVLQPTMEQTVWMILVNPLMAYSAMNKE